MNKKAFTLIEVIISISLLSIVITTVLKIKENNFLNIEKFKNINSDMELLSIASIVGNNKKDNNSHFYLDEIIKNANDELHKKLKNTKVYVKSKTKDSINIDDKTITINETKYSIDKRASTKIYTFSIN